MPATGTCTAKQYPYTHIWDCFGLRPMTLVCKPAPPVTAIEGMRMLPTGQPRLMPIVVIFVASCAIAFLSTLLLNVLGGRSVGLLFSQVALLARGSAGSGLSAVVLLAILIPLRQTGWPTFLAGGLAVSIVLLPILGRLFSVPIEYAAGNPTLAQQFFHWGAQDWFFAPLHFPANLSFAFRGAILLAFTAWFWPLEPDEDDEHWAEDDEDLDQPERPVIERQSGPLPLPWMLLSLAGRLNRRPFVIVALALWLPNAVLQRVLPVTVGLALNLLVFWPLLAVVTKRAHDRERGLGWVALMFCAPVLDGILMQVAVIANPAAPFQAGLPHALLTLAYVFVLPFVWLWGELLFLRGTHGPNTYGADCVTYEPAEAAAEASD